MARCVYSHALTLAGVLVLLAVPAISEQHSQEEMSPEEAAMMAAWQEAMTPGEPHAQLADAVGTWNMTIKSWMDPAGEPMVSQGTSERSMILGGRVLMEKAESEFMGMPFEGYGYTGYDNTTGKYWSIWMDNMSTNSMRMEGSRDEASGDVVYHGEYVDPVSEKTKKVRAVVHRHSATQIAFDWYEDAGEGESKTMQILYVKK